MSASRWHADLPAGQLKNKLSETLPAAGVRARAALPCPRWACIFCARRGRERRTRHGIITRACLHTMRSGRYQALADGSL